jgi:hypothetical protein
VRQKAVLLLTAIAAACQWHTIAPEPLHGPQPHLVLIAPMRDGDAGDRASLLVGAEAALRARGYAVLPLQLGFDLLRQHQLTAAAIGDAAAGLDGIRSTTGADAVLRVDAARFTSLQGSMLERASYALRWQLLSTDGGELWHFELDGDYVRSLDTSPPVEPLNDDERRPTAIGVSTQRPFRDAADLLATLHRAAFEHLPMGGR